MLIAINGKIVHPEKATIDLSSDSIMFGVGVFETLRTYNQGQPFRLREHIVRLVNAANTIGIFINYSSEEIANQVQQLILGTSHKYQRIKIVAFDQKLIILSIPFTPDKSLKYGVQLISIQQRRSLPEIKSTSYLDCLMSYRNAEKKGGYDALLIDESNQVYEGSRSNVFWIKNGQLFTKKNQVLPGITRAIVINDLIQNTQFANTTLNNLLLADEIFITNSIIGICPVVKIDGYIVGSGKVGELTQSLMNRYSALINDSF